MCWASLCYPYLESPVKRGGFIPQPPQRLPAKWIRTGQMPGEAIWLLTVGLGARIIAEHLLNNKLQMSAFGATEGIVALTKQMKIGPCEQVRVN